MPTGYQNRRCQSTKIVLTPFQVILTPFQVILTPFLFSSDPFSLSVLTRFLFFFLLTPFSVPCDPFFRPFSISPLSGLTAWISGGIGLQHDECFYPVLNYLTRVFHLTPWCRRER
ncbi:MAG: hypothetical protein WD894_19350 [Pirellulales bacterium]